MLTYTSDINNLSHTLFFADALKSFIENREFLIILSILSLSLAFVGKNFRAITAQLLLCFTLWIHFTIFNNFFYLFMLNEHLFILYKICLFLLLVIQAFIAIIVIRQLHTWIKRPAKWHVKQSIKKSPYFTNKDLQTTTP